jgi:hypothetical protein
LSKTKPPQFIPSQVAIAHKGSKRPNNLREEHTTATLKGASKQSSEAKKKQRKIQKLTMCTWKD